MREKGYLLQGDKYLNLQMLSDCFYRLDGGSPSKIRDNDLLNK